MFGGSIPRGEVHAAWSEIVDRYDLNRAYCDPRDWQSEICDWSLRYGEKVFLEWATYRTAYMHDALERAVTDLVTGRTSHDGCPITTDHVANSRKVAKPGQRYLLGKPAGAQHQKIDAAMADVLAHEAASDARADGWGQTKTRRVYGFS
jgi:phage terminase large subunit-like protein